MSTPTSTQQARFVTNLQRLLTEGEFVNTYKFALLISLTRWAIEHPNYNELQPLDVCELAPHFANLYWPHVQPFAVRTGMVAEPRLAYGRQAIWDPVIVQDRGQRSGHQVPRVLKQIILAQSTGTSQLHQLPAAEQRKLLAEVRKSIAQMPLPRLHRVRDSDEPIRFLYRVTAKRHEILFEDGIIDCLVHFAPLVEETVRSAWLRFVMRCNPNLLGATAGLESFLFPASRISLEQLRSPLQEVQGDRCFYCGTRVRSTPEVDHFLPWSRYRRDLGHNFVLAHARCNQNKSDHLASCEHLERWCERNEKHETELGQRFTTMQWPHDWPTLRRVAESLYQLADANKARLWQRRKELVPVDPRWRSILGVA